MVLGVGSAGSCWVEEGLVGGLGGGGLGRGAGWRRAWFGGLIQQGVAGGQWVQYTSCSGSAAALGVIVKTTRTDHGREGDHGRNGEISFPVSKSQIHQLPPNPPPAPRLPGPRGPGPHHPS